MSFLQGLFGPPNVEKLKSARDVKGLYKALGYQKESRVRLEAANALGIIGDDGAVKPLIDALKDDHFGVRLNAAIALVKINGVRTSGFTVEALITALLDGNDQVREVVALTVGNSANRCFTEPLIATLKDENKTVRKSAAISLGSMDRTKAVEPLLVVLQDSQDDVREAAAEALGKLGDARAVEPLIAALTDRSNRVQLEAIEALGNIRDPRAVKPLIAKFKIQNAQFRQVIAKSLGKIGDTSAVEILLPAAKNKELRRVVVDALKMIGGAHAVSQLIAALKDGNKDIRQIATEVLGEIRDVSAVEHLVVALKDKTPYVRMNAAEVLGKIEDACAIDPLVETLKDEDDAVCKAAAESLDKLHWQPGGDHLGAAYWAAKQNWEACAQIGIPSIDILIAALKKMDKERQSKITKALIKIEPAKVIDALIYALSNEDYNLRRSAAKALGKIADKRAAEALVIFWMQSGGYEELGRIGPQVVEPFVTAVKSRPWQEMQKGAVDALAKLGWLPENDEYGAQYWILKNDFDRCVEIGVLAIEPLKLALKNNHAQKKQVIKTLAKLGWKPGMDEYGARYWITKSLDSKEREIAAQELDAIGAPAFKPLVETLHHFDLNVRRFSATRLLALYKSGKLNELQKSDILEYRQIIMEAHRDYSHHTDSKKYPSWHTDRIKICFTGAQDHLDTGGGSHNDQSGGHTDIGIGLDFPL
ncbi:MAG: HEAT repeat domain-containing protein [Anaerolineales bacterium]|nr:HEAT repeat domain-containing protein [Anaerolineales bacterium]GER79174.1 oxidoreductase/HEAT repeat-containing protein [Candidatus Denitrolinea symbiosum]